MNVQFSISKFMLCTLLLFLGLNGIIGGLLFMLKPDGSLLGMSHDWLDHAPFKTFFTPGLLLFTCIGLLSSVTFIGLIKPIHWSFFNSINIYKNRYWAWSYSIYTGIITIIWITVQLITTHYFWLQPFIIFIGIGILLFTLMPAVMEHYENP